MERARRAPVVFVRGGEWIRTPALERVVERRDHAAERAAGRYRLSEVIALLAVFAATALLLESDGLLTWAKRLPLGHTRSALLAAIVPAHEAIGRAGFSAPRKRAISVADALATSPIAERPVAATLSRVPAAGVPFFAQDELFADRLLDPPVPLAIDPPPPAPPPDGVLLIGDSMMVAGLGPAIARGLSREGVAAVTDAREATGLARPDVFDWPKNVTGLLARHNPAVVVVTFGANDFNDMESAEGDLAEGSREWEAEYRVRVHAMMTLLAGNGRRVLWLGLPPMREEKFDRRMVRMSKLYASEAKSVPGVEYLDERKALADADGDFEAFRVPDSGGIVQLRMEDGVHLTRSGGEVAARGVLSWIRRERRVSVNDSEDRRSK